MLICAATSDSATDGTTSAGQHISQQQKGGHSVSACISCHACIWCACSFCLQLNVAPVDMSVGEWRGRTGEGQRLVADRSARATAAQSSDTHTHTPARRVGSHSLCAATFPSLPPSFPPPAWRCDATSEAVWSRKRKKGEETSQTNSNWTGSGDERRVSAATRPLHSNQDLSASFRHFTIICS